MYHSRVRSPVGEVPDLPSDNAALQNRIRDLQQMNEDLLEINQHLQRTNQALQQDRQYNIEDIDYLKAKIELLRREYNAQVRESVELAVETALNSALSKLRAEFDESVLGKEPPEPTFLAVCAHKDLEIVHLKQENRKLNAQISEVLEEMELKKQDLARSTMLAAVSRFWSESTSSKPEMDNTADLQAAILSCWKPLEV